MANKRYILQKYTNRSSRYTCPECGQKHCFTLYLDADTMEPVGQKVGRCDHEQSCGYNYTPYQYFQDNPWMRKGAETAKRLPINRMPPVRMKAPYIPMKYVNQRLSIRNTFFDWISTVDIIDWNELERVATLYLLGSTADGKYRENAVIFWQIDRDGNVRDGKMMWYRPDGHRQKWMSWISSKLKEVKKFPDLSTEKCFFGEHLLSIKPSVPVVIVEGEKSAVFCACLMPEYVWIASCGCGGLNAEKMQVLCGRDVIVIPDSGEADKWKRKLDESGVPYRMITDFEHYPANTDIVDLLMDGSINKQYLSTIIKNQL